MAGTILTPLTVWNDFKITETVQANSIGVFKQGDVQVERLKIQGRTCVDGKVIIYAVMARNLKHATAPAIFILQKFSDGADEKLAVELAKKGYTAFVVDISGEDGINYNHTTYPKSLSYIDYKNASNSLFSVGQDVKKTCWYEWGCTARYALQYLKNLDHVTQIGAIGIEDAATVLWHIAGTDKTLACAAFISNAGWGGYSGNYKFSQKIEKEFTDEELMFLAGIEPQTYAGHVTCPTFIAVPTNSGKYDFDRAHDTVSRIQSNVYTAIHYSVGRIDGVDSKAYANLVTFFKHYLPIDGQVEQTLPADLEIKTDLVDGKFIISLKPDANDLKKLSVYASEELLNPSLRQWKKITSCTRMPDGTFAFEYSPYTNSQIAMFFGVAEYKNGFEIGSDVLARRFAPSDVKLVRGSKLIYSSREKLTSDAFYPLQTNQAKPSCLAIKGDVNVVEKKGAMDIVGVTCEGGLLTFRLASKKYKPSDDSMLMLDAYLKQDGVLTITLIADYFGKKTEYSASVHIKGGEIWHNVKLELKNFKTPEALNLKSFEKIEALTVNANVEFLINNLLCV